MQNPYQFIRNLSSTDWEPLGRFKRDRRGSVAIIFGLTILLVVTTVGGAIDYGRWYSAKTKLQYAIDNAALAAGRVSQTSGGNTSEAIAAAQAYYDQMKSMDLVNQSANFSLVDSGRAVEAIVNATVATPFLTFVGYPTLPVNVGSKVILASGDNEENKVEVSMMLDVTGSMSGQKIEDLKLAAKDLVNIVVDSNNPAYARIALVPFSEHVNVGQAYYQMVTGETPETGGTANTCVRERKTADRYTDAPPTSGNEFEEGPDSGWCKPYATIMPLSGDKAALNSHIDGFTTTGRTAGHLGTAWAWYTLSPRWNTVWPGASHAHQYGNPKKKKIAVLMTDGEYNQKYSGDDSAIQAREICASMKAEGITVYSVVFQLASPSQAETTMRQCATSPDHFFNSSTGEELRQAFREIALQISTLRLSK